MTRSELPALRAQITAERERLTVIAAEVATLEAMLRTRPPTRIELMATAAFLHNFYNCLENCMVRIAHGVDESVPAGSDWHRLLLDQMRAPIEGLRPPLLERDLANRIDEYRRFRHAFRHMYFFDLEWARVEPLTRGAEAVGREFGDALDRLFGALAG